MSSSKANQKSLLVIGAGIIGLTTAIRLAEEGHEVAIVAQEIPSTVLSTSKEDEKRTKGTYCSSGSGGLWMPFLLYGEHVERWSTITYKEYEKSAKEEIGITFHEGYFLNANKKSEIPWYGKMTNMEILTHEDDERIPKEYNEACKFRVPVINMELYLPYLEQRAEKLGISITLTSEIDEEYEEEEEEEKGLWDMECINTYTSPDTIIVCCCGVGSSFFCDEKLMPGRGITVRIDKPTGKDYFITEDPSDGFLSEDGTLAYAIPKFNFVNDEFEYTLGGSFFLNDWREYAFEDEIKEVVSRACTILQVDESDVKVNSSWTGLRPVTEDGKAKVGVVDDNVIANFGHGGSGVTTAWGCAEEICKIVSNLEEK